MEGSNLNGLIAAFQRPPWRPGTTALAVMAVALFLFGLIEVVNVWARVGCCFGAAVLASGVNGMEIASPIEKALKKKRAQT